MVVAIFVWKAMGQQIASRNLVLTLHSVEGTMKLFQRTVKAMLGVVWPDILAAVIRAFVPHAKTLVQVLICLHEWENGVTDSALYCPRLAFLEVIGGIDSRHAIHDTAGKWAEVFDSFI